MKIAIVGAGFSGSYLAKRLFEEGIAKLSEITLFDRKKIEDKVAILEDRKKPCLSPCAWGIHTPTLIEAVENANIGEPSDYILQEFDRLNIGPINPKCELCTFNKPLFEWNCAKPFEIKNEFDLSKIDKYDVVVDATGNRDVISKILGSETLKPPLTIYTRQVRIDEKSKDMVINNLDEGIGYEWIFPLGELGTHVGLGLVEKRPPSVLYSKDKSDRIICACRGTIRLSSPEYSFPLYIKRGNTMVITVGESAGMISSVTGGGNKEAIDGVEILIENWDDIPAAYEAIKMDFKWASNEFNLIKKLHEGRKLSLLSCYTLINNARRYGIKIRLKDAVSMVKYILGDVFSED